MQKLCSSQLHCVKEQKPAALFQLMGDDSICVYILPCHQHGAGVCFFLQSDAVRLGREKVGAKQILQ